MLSIIDRLIVEMYCYSLLEEKKCIPKPEYFTYEITYNKGLKFIDNEMGEFIVKKKFVKRFIAICPIYELQNFKIWVLDNEGHPNE